MVKIKFLEDCLLVDDILVMSDLHLGRDDYFENEIFEKLERVFNILGKKNYIVKKIVILGDIKDNFGGISDSEWRGVIKLLDYLIKKVGERNLIIIRGNHDQILEPILNKRGIKLRESYNISGKNVCFLHGDKVFKQCLNGVGTVLMGHIHPSITLRDVYKGEKYKCFLNGLWKKKNIYVIPSFTPLSGGFNLNNMNEYNSDDDFGILNNADLKKLDVIIYNTKEDMEHNFGKLKNFVV